MWKSQHIFDTIPLSNSTLCLESTIQQIARMKDHNADSFLFLPPGLVEAEY